VGTQKLNLHAASLAQASARSRLDKPSAFAYFTCAMRAVVQRVSRASVRIDGQTVGEIGRGLLVLLGIGQNDAEADTNWLIKKLLTLRIFPDEARNMNRSVTDIGGGILVVSQFTLYGDARKGTRPSFSDAMPPADAERYYNNFMAKLRAATSLTVAEGRFAAMMDVELVNDGPVTIVLDSHA
jgi:D-aminoacyl-tRNA deacylase